MPTKAGDDQGYAVDTVLIFVERGPPMILRNPRKTRMLSAPIITGGSRKNGASGLKLVAPHGRGHGRTDRIGAHRAPFHISVVAER